MTTFGDAVDMAQRRHGTIDDTSGLNWAIEVFEELLLRANISRKAFDIDLTAGEAEYDYPATVLLVHHADYVASATESYPLEAVSLETLELMSASYRVIEPSSAPRWFAVSHNETGTVLRFHPVPDETTSTYPKVVIQCSTRPVITASSNLPALLINKDVFTEGILAKHAKLFRDQDYPLLKERYEEGLNKAVASLKNVSTTEPSIVAPHFMFTTPGVV